MRALPELLPDLRGDLLYTQVPALSTGDRGMLDLLTLDRNARLVVLELKADEDLHLPLQALDYWIRVRALNADRQPAPPGSRATLGIRAQRLFPGAEVSLLSAAPHPRRSGPAHSSRQRAGAALFFSGNRVATDRPHRTLAPRVKDRVPQKQPRPSGSWISEYGIADSRSPIVRSPFLTASKSCRVPACPEKSNGTDTCSCTISHFPSILRYTSVTRTVKSLGEPSVVVAVTC